MNKYFDLANPATGPVAVTRVPAPPTDFEKWNSTFNYSLRSRSDDNKNPQPEGTLSHGIPSMPQPREGVYVLDTDRGELYPTISTQINVRGEQQFQNRLQDQVKTTVKESTLYSYSGNVGAVHKNHTDYSQYKPEYIKVGDNYVRSSGNQNFGLKSATEFSYFPGASTTGLNNSVVQNPDAVVKNLYKKPDYNIDGPGTFKGVIPDASRFQNYKEITKPTTNALKLHYNLETADGNNTHDYSILLGKQVSGIENRFTSSYQIAPLLENVYSKIWNPENKGEAPSFYNNQNPQDFSYITDYNHLPENQFQAGGYNHVWYNDKSKDSANAFTLGMTPGINNERLERNKSINDKPGRIYGDKALPGTGWSSNRSIDDFFMNDPNELRRAYTNVMDSYTTLGDTDAHFIKA